MTELCIQENTIKEIAGSVTAPVGFSATGAHVGLRRRKRIWRLLQAMHLQLLQEFLHKTSSKVHLFFGVRKLLKTKSGELSLTAETQMPVPVNSALNTR